MEDAYREKLRNLARGIAKFQELEESERDWLRPLLSKGIQSTLDMLDLITDQPMTYEEISIELDICVSTVKQKLFSLAEGGYPLNLREKSAFAKTGRPRKLARNAAKQKLLELLKELED